MMDTYEMFEKVVEELKATSRTLGRTEVQRDNAADRIYNMERAQQTINDQASCENPHTVKLTVELVKALANGQKIEAIKSYRSLTGWGLKEAKDAVETVYALITPSVL